MKPRGEWQVIRARWCMVVMMMRYQRRFRSQICERNLLWWWWCWWWWCSRYITGGPVHRSVNGTSFDISSSSSSSPSSLISWLWLWFWSWLWSWLWLWLWLCITYIFGFSMSQIPVCSDHRVEARWWYVGMWSCAVVCGHHSVSRSLWDLLVAFSCNCAKSGISCICSREVVWSSHVTSSITALVMYRFVCRRSGQP